MAEMLRRWTAQVRYAVPSTAPDDKRFEPLRYRRGPIWAVVNWMMKGLHDQGSRRSRLNCVTRPSR